jgi:hypothetical protein
MEVQRNGVSSTAGMTHIAIWEYFYGNTADWMGYASDEQYQAG